MIALKCTLPYTIYRALVALVTRCFLSHCFYCLIYSFGNQNSSFNHPQWKQLLSTLISMVRNARDFRLTFANTVDPLSTQLLLGKRLEGEDTQLPANFYSKKKEVFILTVRVGYKRFIQFTSSSGLTMPWSKVQPENPLPEVGAILNNYWVLWTNKFKQAFVHSFIVRGEFCWPKWLTTGSLRFAFTIFGIISSTKHFKLLHFPSNVPLQIEYCSRTIVNKLNNFQ